MCSILCPKDPQYFTQVRPSVRSVCDSVSALAGIIKTLCVHAQHDNSKRSLTLFWGAVGQLGRASPALAVLIDVSFSSHLGDDQSVAHSRCSDGVFSCRGLV